MKKLLLLGSFSGRNIGDDVILRGFLYVLQLKNLEFEIFIPSKSPVYYIDFSPFLRPFRSRVGLLSINTLQALFKSDVLLIPQGSFFSHKLFNPFYNRVITYYLIIQVNKYFAKKPIGLFYAQIGPLFSWLGELFTRIILGEMDFIILRDTQSVFYLDQYNVKTRYRTATDIALFCSPAETTLTHGIKLSISGRKAVGININKFTTQMVGGNITQEEILSVLASFVRQQKNAYYWIFLPSDLEDVKITRLLIDKVDLSKDDYLLIEKCKPEEYITIQTMCVCFIGTRLHSLIMGAIAPVPLIGLNYNPKVHDFMGSLGLAKYCLEYNELSLDLLVSTFNNAISQGAELRIRISEKVSSLKKEIITAFDDQLLPFLK